MRGMEFFATAAKGTEPALRDELRELRFSGVRADRGGVHFSGSFEDGWRACLYSRVAVRVLAWRGTFEAKTGDELYEGIAALEWRHFLTAKHTLAVRASCRSSQLTHSQFVAQRTKDAIVDQLRDTLGARPSVNIASPDLLVVVHLVKDQADVYLDLAGDSLHLRGYRTRVGAAPLKETLAAAMLRLSGWDREQPLCDPMCGAGTIAIEAAAWARAIPPGLAREKFGFERWAHFDSAMASRLAELRAEGRAAIRPPPRGAPTVVASDHDPAMVERTRANARDAGIDLIVEQRDVRRIGQVVSAPTPGFIVTNPPYGERLEAGGDFFAEMAAALSGLRDHTVGVLAGTPEIERSFAAKPAKWWILYNGPIECRFLVYRNP